MKRFVIEIYKYTVRFQIEANTSRGTMGNKPIYILKFYEEATPEIAGYGECSPLQGLSIDDRSDYFDYLQLFSQKWLADGHIHRIYSLPYASAFPSILFGIETCWYDWKNGGKHILYENPFTTSEHPISINGLIWMNSISVMKKQVKEKINSGFKCIKIKIGGLHFQQECDFLSWIRDNFDNSIEIRVDANGSMAPQTALKKLETLSKFQIHSIEQPIAVRQWKVLSQLSQLSPIPIVLDEEIIGLKEEEKLPLLDEIKPAMLVLKPNLIGGLQATQEWIKLCKQRGISWWITSSLESNIGLSALCQWIANDADAMKTTQGLGTGGLYSNNFSCPLILKGQYLSYDKKKSWGLQELKKPQMILRSNYV